MGIDDLITNGKHKISRFISDAMENGSRRPIESNDPAYYYDDQTYTPAYRYV